MPYKDSEKKKLYDAKWKLDNKDRVNKLANIARAKRRDVINKRARDIYNQNKQHISLLRIKRIYDLTPEQYFNLVEKQGKKCSICENDTEILHVDHCHFTGDIRGLLCFKCNTGLGQFRDSRTLLQRAILYLDSYEESE